MEEMEFADPKKIALKHPDDRRFPPGTHKDPPIPGRGMWAADVILHDGRRCASVFIGQGRAVLISPDGHYIGDECAGDAKTRVENGAWVPESVYRAAEREDAAGG